MTGPIVVNKVYFQFLENTARSSNKGKGEEIVR